MRAQTVGRAGPKDMSKREFPLFPRDFERLQSLAYEHTGIVLSDAKIEMVYSRLARRIRVIGLRDFAEYCRYLDDHSEAEFTPFINAITTNLTSFFRESHHFDYFKTDVANELRKQHMRDRRIRMWCCAASTGEEPYSLAMLVRECLPQNWDIRILATDLDSEVLATAQAGVYNETRVDGMDAKRLQRFFLSNKKDRDASYKIKPDLAKLIAFKELNLTHKWPMSGPFDVVFCRNVVIYFDKQTQKQLFDKIADLMPIGGHLFIGHSESLHQVTTRFKSLGRTIYRKVR